MSTQRKIISISVSKAVEADLKKISREEQKNRSDVIREALRQYKLERQWFRLRRIGSRLASRLGIETDEDILKLMNR